MEQSLVYNEIAFPQVLAPYIQRVIVADVPEGEVHSTVGRPTGYSYIGWLPEGRCEASAGGQVYDVGAGAFHLSGQLTVFDAKYKIFGPAKHYLAKCTATGFYRLTGVLADGLISQLSYGDSIPLQHKQRSIGLNDIVPISDSQDYNHTFFQILSAMVPHALPKNEALEQAVVLIEQNRGKYLLNQITQDLGVSERHMRRLFVEQVGLSPKRFAVVHRILHALQLLTAPDAPKLADVAAQTGFSDQSHLSNVFKLYVQTTPAQVDLEEDGTLRSIVRA